MFISFFMDIQSLKARGLNNHHSAPLQYSHRLMIIINHSSYPQLSTWSTTCAEATTSATVDSTLLSPVPETNTSTSRPESAKQLCPMAARILDVSDRPTDSTFSTTCANPTTLARYRNSSI